MDLVVASIVARWKWAKGEDLPDRWNEWVDEVYLGGKRKVLNPNQKSRESNPFVTFNTAIKDPAYFKSALKAYQAWLEKGPKEEGSGERPSAKEEKPAEPQKPSVEEAPKAESKPKEEPKSEPKPKEKDESGGEPSGKTTDFSKQLASDSDIDRLAQEHKEQFTGLTKRIKSELASYDKKMEKDPIMKKFFLSLPEQERMIHVGGYLIGRYFEQNVLSKDPELKKFHDDLFNGWEGTSGFWMANLLQGGLSSMGVNGSVSPMETDIEKKPLSPVEKKKGVLRPSKARSQGAKDKKVQDYLKKVYAFQQAYFKHLGLEEMTVYRGVEGQGLEKEPPSVGSSVQFETRELSSFSTDASAADAFGRVTQFKVPVSRVWGTCCISPRMGKDPSFDWDESEVLLLGASDLEGTVVSKAKGVSA